MTLEKSTKLHVSWWVPSSSLLPESAAAWALHPGVLWSGWDDLGKEVAALRGRSIETKCAQAHCTLTHSLGSQLFLGRSGCPEESELGVGKCCPCGHFLYYNLTTCLQYLQFRSWGLLMTAAFRKVTGECLAGKSTNTTGSKIN